jgi:hypothetical protein
VVGRSSNHTAGFPTTEAAENAMIEQADHNRSMPTMTIIMDR